MKKYFNTILIASILLLIFPFLALPELWEHIYVSLLAFIIGYSSMLLRHKVGLHGDDEDLSLQEYVQELKEHFKKEEPQLHSEKQTKKISDIALDEK